MKTPLITRQSAFKFLKNTLGGIGLFLAILNDTTGLYDRFNPKAPPVECQGSLADPMECRQSLPQVPLGSVSI